MQANKELSSGIQEIIAEIREALEVKLVGILLTSDIDIKLEERKDWYGYPVFRYEMRNRWSQHFNILEVSIKEYWNSYTYTVVTNITTGVTQRDIKVFDDHQHMIKYIGENVL